MSGFVEITVSGKSGGTGSAVTLQTLTPTDEINDALAVAGLDPARVNTVLWPAYGASRFATAVVLMARDAVEDDTDGLQGIATDGSITGGKRLYVTLNYNGRSFTQMIVGRCVPVLVGVNTSIYWVELHCRRWLWRHLRPRGSKAYESVDGQTGYNMTGLSRGRFRRRSLSSDAMWNCDDIVTRELAGDATNGHPALAVSTDQTLSLLAGLYVEGSSLAVDISPDDSVAALIDRVLAKSGGVLSFVPSVTGGKQYDLRIESIDTGEARAATFIETYEDEILAGGMEGPVVDRPTTSGAGSFAVGGALNAIKDCPLAVRVYFPLAKTDQTDDVIGEYAVLGVTPDGGASSTDHSILDNKFATRTSWDSSSGDPYDAAYDDIRPVLHHIRADIPLVTFGRDLSSASDLLNGTPLSAIAGYAAEVFYARWLAGCCDIWLRDTVPLTAANVWAGGLWWEYSLREDQYGNTCPVTHIWGDRDDNLFGYQPFEGPEPVVGLGTCSAYRAADGGVRVIGHQIGHVPVMIRIKDATGDGDNKWVYEAVLLQRDDAASGGWVEGATITAYNTVERNNSSSFAGPSWKLALAVPGTWNILPIGEDRDGTHQDVDTIAYLVEDRKYADERFAYFSLTNIIDGEC